MDDNTPPGERTSIVTIQRWGALASFVLAAVFIAAPLIYLTGNLRTALGPFAYDLADLLYGPVWAASLVGAVFALRERIGPSAGRRMHLALLSAFAAAAFFVAVACIRAANRHYHLAHPELNLENSTSVLVVWTTLVAGLSAAGWHFLGWVQALLGWSAWTTRRLPRGLGLLYLAAAIASILVYRLPEAEGVAVTLMIVVSLWQSVCLWRGAHSPSPA